MPLSPGLGLVPRICLRRPSPEARDISIRPLTLRSASPQSLHIGGAGMLTCCPSATPFGLALGTGYPWAELPSPGTLRLSASRILTCFIVTHSGIVTCTPRHRSFRYGLFLAYSAPLPLSRSRRNATTHCFGAMLTPDHFWRGTTRPVSYYALFKWWLLLSQHPGCLSSSTSFVTKHGLGTLAGGLGCFPLDREAYPSRTDSRDSRTGIRSLVREGTRRRAPAQFSLSTPGA